MTGTLVVTPEKLISTSQEFSGKAAEINGLTNQMLQLVAAINSVWSGEASTVYSTKFNGLNNDMNRIYKMVTEHAEDLQEMANNYMNNDNEIIETSNALKTDVIS